MIRPVRKFGYQELKGWLGWILSYPEMELALEASLSNISVPHTGNEPFYNIFDASFPQHFNGYDGKPFLRKDNKLRLLFSLAVDGFNPFGMKVTKGTSSVTGIYMACLNLPADIRYNTENMYLCGVIPGPKKPSLEQINNFIRPLVNELLEFWNPDVFFSRMAVTTVTSDHPVPYCPIASTRSPSVYSMYSPFPFLSICLVAPPIGERVVRSVSLYNYLICFLSCFRSLYVPVPFRY